MIAYHVTTYKKYQRYLETGCILPPVRFWRTLDTARSWARRTNRHLIISFETDESLCYPLPDHQPRGMAWWADKMIRPNTFKNVFICELGSSYASVKE